ncbi:hypothetical protein EYZ11_013248 [Aspergillus tanneri]|uniref:Uncharacterized protein n=1 Tax=Aspergillus tanneri TaxID=1220188 RepID=A0A4S3J090_9EURO|nr:hypothetical protein EYZ11_013248 [Aspergillus tanneri]
MDSNSYQPTETDALCKNCHQFFSQQIINKGAKYVPAEGKRCCAYCKTECKDGLIMGNLKETVQRALEITNMYRKLEHEYQNNERDACR